MPGQIIAAAPVAGKQADDEAPGRVQHHDGRILAFMPQQGGQHAHGNARGPHKDVRRMAAVFFGQKSGQVVNRPNAVPGQAGRGAERAGRHNPAARRAPGIGGQPGGQPPGQGQPASAQDVAGQRRGRFLSGSGP